MQAWGKWILSLDARLFCSKTDQTKLNVSHTIPGVVCSRSVVQGFRNVPKKATWKICRTPVALEVTTPRMFRPEIYFLKTTWASSLQASEFSALGKGGMHFHTHNYQSQGRSRSTGEMRAMLVTLYRNSENIARCSAFDWLLNSGDRPCHIQL